MGWAAAVLELSESPENVLFISPEIIVSHSKFKRLNKWLEEKGVLVEKVDYSNISKMSGLFRCSTLPLTREL